jgi:pSer/pThr/pTyr-binding forkhead associated (FHA) protein
MGDPTAALPADEATVQLLPGRLTILVGAGRDREFRFIRTPGQVTEVTIGREAGSGPHHVQLAALTVSRLHARMRFEDGGWRIENLSRTNPLVINGQPTSAELPVRLLEEGDRIEIGEFVLLFHER